MVINQQGISTISDSLLTNIKRPDIDTSGEMIGQLTKLIKKFDISEVEKLQVQLLLSNEYLIQLRKN